MIRVELNRRQIDAARELGMRRHYSSFRKALNPAHGAPGDEAYSKRVNCYGALGEFAAAEYLGLPEPDSVDTFKTPDLQHRIQVRTRLQEHYDLIVRSDDADDEIFVLVYIQTATTRTPPVPYVRGWCFGREAKTDDYAREHGNRERAYFVPAADLRSMVTLRERITPMDPATIKPLHADEINW
jgi:hypothetical protein